VPVPAVLCGTLAEGPAGVALSPTLGSIGQKRRRFCVVSIVTRPGLNDPAIKSPQGLKIYLFSNMSALTLVSTQPPIPWVTRAHSQRLKRPVGEANHLRPSLAEVKNKRS
jgi:hypothetical protein